MELPTLAAYELPTSGLQRGCPADEAHGLWLDEEIAEYLARCLQPDGWTDRLLWVDLPSPG